MNSDPNDAVMLSIDGAEPIRHTVKHWRTSIRRVSQEIGAPKGVHREPDWARELPDHDVVPFVGGYRATPKRR